MLNVTRLRICHVWKRDSAMVVQELAVVVVGVVAVVVEVVVVGMVEVVAVVA